MLVQTGMRDRVDGGDAVAQSSKTCSHVPHSLSPKGGYLETKQVHDSMCEEEIVIKVSGFTHSELHAGHCHAINPAHAITRGAGIIVAALARS